MTTNVALHHRASRLRTTALVLFAAALGLVMAAGCLDTANERDPNRRFDPLNQPEFLTPVAESQKVGIDPHWMGDQFRVGDLQFNVSVIAHLYSKDTDPNLHLNYVAALEDDSDPRGGGTALLNLLTYGDAVGSRERAERAASRYRPDPPILEDVRVGPWDGVLLTEVNSLSPVNRLVLYVGLPDGVVAAEASSGSSGIPGSDSNPLIDSDLLIEVVEAHLRPYPE